MEKLKFKKILLSSVSGFLAVSQILSSSLSAVYATEETSNDSTPVSEETVNNSSADHSSDGTSTLSDDPDSQSDLENTDSDEREPVNWTEEDSFSWIVYGDKTEDGESSAEIGFQFKGNELEIAEGDYAELILPDGVIISDQNGGIYHSSNDSKEVIGSYFVKDGVLHVDFDDTLNEVYTEKEITRISLNYSYANPDEEISWLLNAKDTEPYILNRLDQDSEDDQKKKTEEKEQNENDDSIESEPYEEEVSLFSTSITGGSSQSAARSISTNTEYQDHLIDYSTERWYKFSISSPGTISISFNHNYIQNNATWLITLYNSSSQSLIDFTSARGDTTLTSYNTGSGTGTYYIKVRPSTFNSSYYTFKVNYTASSKRETELNDDTSTADVIAVNNEYTGSIGDYYDNDWYKFAVLSPGTLSITFKHPYIEQSASWRIELYDANIKQLYTFVSSRTETVWTSPNSGVSGGTYYLKITPSTLNRSDYSFKVNYSSSSIWETEFNDSTSTADSISVNKLYKGSISSSDDKDWYKFSVSAPGTLSVSFGHDYLENNATWNVILYNSDIKELVNSYSYRSDTNLTSVRVGVPKGTYYIKVSPSTTNNSDYWFKANYTQTSDWEKELNDSFGTATQISVNKSWNGSISSYDEPDYYSFNLSSRTSLTMDLTQCGSESRSWRVQLFDSTQRELFSKSVYCRPTQSIDFGSLSAGRYYLRLSNNSSQEYQFNLHQQLPFVDVPKGHWAASSILEATQLGIIQGYDANHFGPNDNLSRAMTVTILWRMAGEPSVSGSHPFNDVKSSDWFNKAVLWASKKGIVNGYTTTRFAPYDNVTREQLAVMIVNYLKSRGVNTNVSASLSQFKDGGNVHSYAVSAVKYCVAKGILSGKDGGTRLDPFGTATRAEAAKMLTAAYHLQ